MGRRHTAKPLGRRIVATAVWELLPLLAFAALLLL
jgi:hypothetical protein